MAVPAYLRDESKAKFVTKAVRLAALTLKWCKDERLFTRRERWIITGDVWAQAKRVLLCVKQANGRKDVTNPRDLEARTNYLCEALDALAAYKMLLTIKYEMMLQGFDAPKQPAQGDQLPPPPPAPPENGQEGQGKKKRRGGKKRLTQDDIDDIFEQFFDLAIQEEDLINGVMRSDAARYAEAHAANE